MNTILFLQEDMAALRHYTKILENAGYKVSCVSTIQALQVMLERKTFDLIIADIQVGRIKSKMVLSTLMDYVRVSGTALLMTCDYKEEDISICEALNLPHLVKPFSNIDLINSVTGIFARTAKSCEM